jgi:small subunit ribosomal protein S20
LANTRSAEKRNRQAQKRRQRNVHVRTTVKSAVKKLRDAMGSGDAGTAQTALKQAVRELDRASTRGVLHKNAASRKISRLTRAVAKAARPAQPQS